MTHPLSIILYYIYFLCPRQTYHRFDDITSLEHTIRRRMEGRSLCMNTTHPKRNPSTRRRSGLYWTNSLPCKRMACPCESRCPCPTSPATSFLGLEAISSPLPPSSKIFPGLLSPSLVTHSEHPSEINMKKNAFEGLALRKQQLLLFAIAVEDKGSPDEKTASRISCRTQG